MTEHDVEDLETIVHRRVGSVVVGKYTLDRVIGIGGMAAVYAATHRNQAEFAVKMLHPELSSQDDLRSRFLREGYIANSVKHAGAVRVVDDDVTEDGAAFLVMELLDGTTVEDLWFRGDRHIPLRPALAITYQLLDVLAAAHTKNIVHRDIKPANLFVTSLGDLKVLDFGIARLRDATMNAITQAGAMLGTPAFMAPEQARGQSKEVDGQTDVWAVGATLFSLVSGHLVHEAESATMLLLRAATTQARSLSSVVRDVPASIAALVDKALAFEKPSRWESAGAMRDAVNEAYVAEFDEPLTREVLHAYFVQMESEPGPPPSRREEPESGSSPTPPPDTDAVVRTKVEGTGAPKVEPAPPAEREPPPVEPPPASAAPAPASVVPASAPATEKAIAKRASAEAPPVAAPAPAHAKPPGRPVLLGAVLLIALVLGVVALLWGDGR